MTIALYVLGVLLLLLGVAISIALHEMGHLLPAKKFGVKVNQYMIGFGPTVFSRRRGETEYGVKLLPLGGYIAMIGMFPPKPGGGVRRSSTGMFQTMIDDARKVSAEEMEPGDEKRAFYNLSVPKKLVVMMGGPTMNLVIGIVLLAVVVCGIGFKTPTTTVETVSQCVVGAQQAAARQKDGGAGCKPSDPRSPAVSAHVKQGDTIESIGGTPTPTWQSLSRTIEKSAGETVPVVVERSGRTITLHAHIATNKVAEYDADGNYKKNADGTIKTREAGFFGVGPTYDYHGQPVTALPAVVGNDLVRIFDALVHLPQRLTGVAQSAFTSAPRAQNSPVGMIGIGRAAGEIATTHTIDVEGKIAIGVNLLATLNMFLFAFNLVPLLPLDGGHIAGALFEGIRRRMAAWSGRADPGPADVAKLMPVTYVVVGLMLAMTLLLGYADIVKPIKLF
ncbi:M50 family metallopeptidase [Spelaeicoccus albus]|uniref:Membrane-associated protease RseP (Regulator of RpoE activity) n=1 Tax=Spelaeicoccus albus TaxID=1280376 RepID=A0A7Z0D2N9_9MICO|nr:site-2 protease family protein [Spelaeicoccus albus]NYI67766.1 membrane-associated protease RseP (regulator of RpoE activity) [Spelaeicoccus albus]